MASTSGQKLRAARVALQLVQQKLAMKLCSCVAAMQHFWSFLSTMLHATASCSMCGMRKQKDRDSQWQLRRSSN